VQVGTQVSGTIASLGADFNSRVRKGQRIAKIDPALFEAAVQQARANLVAAQGNLQELGRAGMTVVLVTHEADIAEYASRVITMRDGLILADARRAPRVARRALPPVAEEVS
jgi:multidrug resistance efflux pump